MSIHINRETQNNKTNYFSWILISLVICIFVGLQVACFNSNQKTTDEARKNELQEKENLKIQREELLKFLGTKLAEFVKLAPPTKLAPQPYLKGKTVIVDVSYDGEILLGPFYYGYDLTDLPEMKLVYPNYKGDFSSSSEKNIWNKTFGVKSIAKKADDDIQTVIQLKFTDTKVCRRYGSADFFKGASLCGKKAEVTVIDKTIPAIIAKKTLTNNKKLPETVEVIEKYYSSDISSNSIKDPYQMYPFNEIEEYLKNLEQK